jgi:predicted alpha-1,2-mannosidase
MKHQFKLVAVGTALMALALNFATAESGSVLKYVDPFIGTGDHGHTFPGATTPFGMVQLSPDTRTAGWDACGGYYNDDTEILGFSHTHLSGTGIGDYGDVLIMPFTGEVNFSSGTLQKPDYGYRSPFKKENQVATPGYYKVLLDRFHITTELTATPRVGISRHTFPQTATAGFVIDMKHSLQNKKVLEAELEIVSDHEIAGWRHVSGWAPNRWIYFHAEFSKPFKAVLYSDDAAQKTRSVTGKNVKAKLEFSTQAKEKILVKVGISPVDMAGAKKNLVAELPGWDFDGAAAAAKKMWEQQLGGIQLSGGSDEQKKVFYTALYHASISPNLASDADGRYRDMNQQIHQDANFTNYTVFSLWDTFRAQHPLQTIIHPDLDQAWIRSLLRSADEGGILPMWPLAANYTGCMIGYHAVSVIVDAYMKGLRDFDTNKALDAVVFASVYDDKKPIPYNSDKVKEDLMPKAKLYNATLGFIPADLEIKSVSKALEFAYDDWCIATMAKAMGRADIAAEYFKRAKYYTNYFDPKTGFMRGKKKDGTWVEPFNPTDSNHKGGEYTEGNAWQWTWFVPQDLPGLMELYGGRAGFAKKLNETFTTASIQTSTEAGQLDHNISGLIGQYAHGNEPSHHIVYLFNWAEQPWRTDELVYKIMAEFYPASPAGLIGNEDCGQMSAWFVLSALGVYQVTPGDPRYSLGRPLFPEARVALPNGKTFVVRMKNGAANHPYVQRVTLNGVPVKTPFISYADIMAGAELVFEMGDQKTVFWK